MLTNWIGNIVTNGNYDEKEFNTNVMAGLKIAEITALFTKGYCSMV